MKNLRIYGNPPFKVAVLHGGPGATRQMAPVARELSLKRGVLEPLQTASLSQIPRLAAKHGRYGIEVECIGNPHRIDEAG